MHTIYYKDQKMHFGFVAVIYYILIADMFRPFMWPSSGWWKQENKYNYVSKPLRSLKKSYFRLKFTV